MLNSRSRMANLGYDAVALKPREIDLRTLTSVPVDRLTVDYEGPDALPSQETLDRLAEIAELRVTVPVRADGFDPLGDARHWNRIPSGARIALVAGNPAYLSSEECRRPIAPRLAAGLERAPNAWVGTEGIERIALATGAPQFELLASDTERRVRALRDAGFDGEIAVYAPTVLSGNDDTLLEALGPYVGRRREVARALPAGSSTDASARGRAREVLLAACGDYAIAGDPDAVRERIADLRAAGVDHVVGYPPRGLEVLNEQP